MVYNVHSVNKM